MTCLFVFLFKEIEKNQVSHTILVSTCGDCVVSSSTKIDLNRVSGCTHEKADTRVFLHAAVYLKCFPVPNATHNSSTFIYSTTENASTATSAHAIASSLVADKSRALPVFHAITGCDTVSFFGWKGKLKAWNTWTAFPTVTSASLELGTGTANLSQEAFEKIEQFVVFMHEKKSTVTTVNAAKQKLFSQGCKAINPYISTEHQCCHLRPPGDGPKTKDNYGSHYGQHFARLRTRTTNWSTVAANKAVKQDANMQLPTFHVWPWATLKETSVQTTLMTAFESSSRICVSCCNFTSVQAMNLLSCRNTGLRLLNW